MYREEPTNISGWDSSQTYISGISPDGRYIYSNPGTQESGAASWYGPAAPATSGASGGGYGGGYSVGGGGAVSAQSEDPFNLDVKIPAIRKNTVPQPKKLGKKATDKQKADYWTANKKYLNGEADSNASKVDNARAKLARAEAQYSAPGHKMTEKEAQTILNLRQALADAETNYQRVKDKADKIDVSTGVTTSKDGDKETVTTTYTITDSNGKTVSTQYSKDNGGMTQSELRQKQQTDMQKALNAKDAKIASESAKRMTEVQGRAERDFALNTAETNLKAWEEQYGRNLERMDSDYAADRLQGNQDLLMASNETQSQAVKNMREANQILGQYNLGGSSLTNRLGQIAADAANQANQVASLTYSQRMQEAAKNYGNARGELEDQNAAQLTANSQQRSQAYADFYSRLGETAGQNAASMSQYANPDYWKGVMYNSQGKRMNSADNPNSEKMQDYADMMAQRYKTYADAYTKQQNQWTERQTNQQASNYVSNYKAPAQQTYNAGLKSYTPVNATIPGQAPYMEREKERQL
jgi:hypothetical protein